MRWLLPRAILLIFIFSAISGASIWIARQQPAPERVAMLHLTDCQLPCWIGITPGVTTMDEAEQKILRVYGNAPNIKIEFIEGDQRFQVKNAITGKVVFDVYLRYSSRDDSKIYSIAILFDNQPPSIGDLITLLGHPTRIAYLYPIDIKPPPVLIYKNYGLAIIYAGTLELNAEISLPVDRLILWTDDMGTLSTPQPWSGFHSYDE